jgi:DNA-binding transcriptional LysR family regulator
MTLKQLQAFYWAARLGSFAIAADRLSISQSSLSKRIAELESALGAALFDRSARRAVLTLLGEAIVEDAHQMLMLEAALVEKTSTSHPVRGILRIGIGELSAATWFPKFVRSAAAAHPGLVLEPSVGQARSMEAEVERGTLDCAVIAGSPMSPRLESQVLCSVPFSWMAAPGLRLRGMVLTPETLSQHAVIAPNSLSGLAHGFGDLLARMHARGDRLIRCNSLNAIVELTVSGAGISMLPQKHMQPLLRRKLLVRLKSAPEVPPLEYSIVWRRDDIRPSTEAVRELVREVVNFDATSPLWR